MSMSEAIITATGRWHFNKWLATAVCCGGVVLTGLSFENSAFSLFMVTALCVGLLWYGVSLCGSRMRAAKLLLINSGLLALIFVLLRVILNKVAFRFPAVFWP